MRNCDLALFDTGHLDKTVPGIAAARRLLTHKAAVEDGARARADGISAIEAVYGQSPDRAIYILAGYIEEGMRRGG